MKLNVQTPCCITQKSVVLRTKPPMYNEEGNISYYLIITCYQIA